MLGDVLSFRTVLQILCKYCLFFFNPVKKWVEELIRHFSRRKCRVADRYMERCFIPSHQGDTNQNHSEMSPHTCQNGCHQKEHMAQVLANLWRKGSPSCCVGGNVNCSYCGEQDDSCSKNRKHHVTQQFPCRCSGQFSRLVVSGSFGTYEST